LERLSKMSWNNNILEPNHRAHPEASRQENEHKVEMKWKTSQPSRSHLVE
jgi:hypothetical protein